MNKINSSLKAFMAGLFLALMYVFPVIANAQSASDYEAYVNSAFVYVPHVQISVFVFLSAFLFSAIFTALLQAFNIHVIFGVAGGMIASFLLFSFAPYPLPLSISCLLGCLASSFLFYRFIAKKIVTTARVKI